MEHRRPPPRPGTTPASAGPLRPSKPMAVRMENPQLFSRTRSRSLFTIADSLRHDTAPFSDARDFQFRLDGPSALRRRKSSLDPTTPGLLGLSIPHYRLGTPQFRESGTPYFYSSAATHAATDRRRSSLYSRDNRDRDEDEDRNHDMHRRFPLPPGRSESATPTTAHSATTSWPPTGALPTMALYDYVYAHLHDPSQVRYAPGTKRIVAATIGRLIAQITSPSFLDYELLSDFFLTYRNFITPHACLDHLLIRMKWAMSKNDDDGRIVRVRTFVAMRHWILNYFQDDFNPDRSLRLRLCTLVNDLTRALRRRADRGGSDLNVMVELKKCWRRTCATFWSIPDALETSPDADITPGDDRVSVCASRAPRGDFFPDPRRSSARYDFRRSSQIQLVVHPETAAVVDPVDPNRDSDPGLIRTRSTSIPAAPLSGETLQILCCSLPFLRYLQPVKDQLLQAASPGSVALPPLSVLDHPPDRAAPTHKRDASFTDALRDKPSPTGGRPRSTDQHTLPWQAFPGGLVRGLLLQPPPSKMGIFVPLTPHLDNMLPKTQTADNSYFGGDARDQSAGARRIVRDVRRVLGSRRDHREAAASVAKPASAALAERDGPMGWQKLRDPPRYDLLAEKLRDLYQEVFQEHLEPLPLEPVPPSDPPEKAPDPKRSGRRSAQSHANTTGSRSILIVDDTGQSQGPASHGHRSTGSDWTDEASTKPLWTSAGADDASFGASTDCEHHDESGGRHLVVDARGNVSGGKTRPRQSSNVHPSGLDMRPGLRRRPGGDLKAAEHVHDLASAPRPDTASSNSTVLRATSGAALSARDISTLHGGASPGTRSRSPPQSMGLLPTHSSQPNLRPSLVQQISHLAELPDLPRDGGVDDALAKLEGKPSRSTLRDSTTDVRNPPLPAPQRDSGTSFLPRKPRTRSQVLPLHVASRRVDVGMERASSITQLLESAPSSRPSEQGNRHGGGPVGLTPRSEESGIFGAAAVAAGRDEDRTPEANASRDLRETTSASTIGIQTSSDKNAREERDKPSDAADSHRPSFLLEDRQSLSDISTEMADQSDDESPEVRSFLFDETVNEASAARSTKSEQQRISGDDAGAHGSLDGSRRGAAAMPPGARPPDAMSRAHLPFIIAFESDLIAEQMTIVEKDAIDDVDWKDLMALQWQQRPPATLDWVTFLRRGGTNGVDMVITRFNLVVQWVVSQCVLTASASERAKCITKFVHVATHCHRLRNYASLYQLTLALGSAALAPLHRTWALVPRAERDQLARFDALCHPRRNFAALRADLDALPAATACIPFLGLYTHDLVANAQKPATLTPPPSAAASLALPSSPDAAAAAAAAAAPDPLVHFERQQCAAAIVKSLLRLIDASSLYRFHPHPELLSRCLWLAALDDSEIGARTRGLE